jgi:peptidoglycan L-alanyl-D-glutamate endopeptidase CwlK
MARATHRVLLLGAALLGGVVLHIALLGCAGRLVLSQGWWMRWLPGEDIASLDVLHPELRPRVDTIVAELEAQGWQVRVSSGWRSAERQEAIFALGQLGEFLGQAPWTRVRGGCSCHNQLRDDGSPGAAAVDLAPAGVEDLDQRAAFYRALGEAAHGQGLRWGGDFGRSNPIWARLGLGWDPAHIEDQGLCRSLRARVQS